MTDSVISRADARIQGLKFYFTGTPCHRGHIAQRYVSKAVCVLCDAENLRKWRCENRLKVRENDNTRNATPGYARERRLALRRLRRQKNHERILADEAKDRAEHPERHRKRAEKYRKANVEKERDRVRKYRADNPEVRQRWLDSGGRQKDKEWREANKEKLKQYFAQWAEDNREKKYSYIHKRRALKKESSGTHTAAEAAAILVAQNYQCAYCDADLRQVTRHLDHIMPLSKGGSNDKSNIQWTCAYHNIQKGDKDPIEYAKSIGITL